jgi:hypothetical protein
MSKNLEALAWRPALDARDASRTVRLELSIDTGAILDQLGPKALRSKKGISRIVNGAVVVTVRKQQP